jgi:hypothetical protein
MRQRTLVVVGLAVAAIALTVLGGAAVAGQAATTQQVTASLECEPDKGKLGGLVGCLLTATNDGGNSVSKVVVKVETSGGTFVSTTDSRCTGLNTGTLTCSIAKLATGASFTEVHEIRAPTSGASITQTVSGQYSSPSGNNRGSANILPPDPLTTTLDGTDDYDGQFANASGDSAETKTGVSSLNPYSTNAKMLSDTAFAVGVTVQEREAQAADPNCPNEEGDGPNEDGCFGGQVIDFDITSLGDSPKPDRFRLTITVYVGPGVQEDDIEIYHNGALVPDFPLQDPVGASVTDVAVDTGTKIATIVVEGPGTGNGSWGAT